MVKRIYNCYCNSALIIAFPCTKRNTHLLSCAGHPETEAELGEFVDVTITDATEYDLVGKAGRNIMPGSYWFRNGT